MVDESKCPACGKREVRPRYIAPTPSSSRRPVLPAIAQLWGCPIISTTFHPSFRGAPSDRPFKNPPSPPLRRQIKHEEDLGCDICAACGHVVNERGLTSQVQWTEDAGAMGTYVHEDRGGQLAAARGGLSIGVSGVGAHIAKQFFRDEEATHMENITKSVNFACGQLRLSKDAAADAKALVVKACDGRWGDGEWTTMLTGACVYAASRQNQLPITVRDVAEACQLDVFALGRVYNRLKFLHELKVPPLDPGKFVARAAAAIPELREAIDASSAGADNDETGPSAPAPVRRSRLNVERPGNNNADKPTPAVDRGAKLAPVIEDARRLLTFADTREDAIDRLVDVLDTQVRVYPVKTNAGFLRRALTHADFRAGEVDTRFIDARLDELAPKSPPAFSYVAAALGLTEGAGLSGEASDPWSVADGFRANADAVVELGFQADDARLSVSLERKGDVITARIGEDSYTLTEVSLDKTKVSARLNGREVSARLEARKRGMLVSSQGETHLIGLYNPAAMADALEAGGAVKAPMPGKVLSVPVKAGDSVKKGQTLLIVEAMKVMNPITAPRAGKVTQIIVQNEQPVEFDQPLVIIE